MDLAKLPRRLLGLLLLPGGVPEHVAFIMDGNRRFANKEHIDKLQGHEQGYSKVGGEVRACASVCSTRIA